MQAGPQTWAIPALLQKPGINQTGFLPPREPVELIINGNLARPRLIPTVGSPVRPPFYTKYWNSDAGPEGLGEWEILPRTVLYDQPFLTKGDFRLYIEKMEPAMEYLDDEDIVVLDEQFNNALEKYIERRRLSDESYDGPEWINSVMETMAKSEGSDHHSFSHKNLSDYLDIIKAQEIPNEELINVDPHIDGSTVLGLLEPDAAETTNGNTEVIGDPTGLDGFEVLGIVGGVFVLVLLIVFGVWWCRVEKKSICGKSPEFKTPYGFMNYLETDNGDPCSRPPGTRRLLSNMVSKPLAIGAAVPKSVLVLSCFTQVLWIVLGYFLFKRYKKSRADAARREMVIPLHD